MEKDPAIYVRHILEAIANIEADIVGYDFERFRADRRTRQLVERNLEILSEASRRLPDEYKDREAQIPWALNRRYRQRPATRLSPNLSNRALGYVRERSQATERRGSTYRCNRRQF
jgi:uncharacterized protein with HEPN domain